VEAEILGDATKGVKLRSVWHLNGPIPDIESSPQSPGRPGDVGSNATFGTLCATRTPNGRKP
jgi:hypothetical protein